ncbi:MAG: tRNA (adenosine(37)-N6)-dimethylallyltransferase MiaA [Helicobacteraceae bacterium]|nr:tRNA (adenosine(37)-N6)-dimethylallyltransferase MiaA [Helicobacteraceae bacterium]
MKTLAIIGQSASGKSDLAHKIARKTNAVLLSMDSLCAYQKIDVASAKPTKIEREDLTYFGLDIVQASERFGADEFIAEFLRAKAFCEASDRNLIIVGGSGFYLKALIGGLSPIPKITYEIKSKINDLLRDVGAAYNELKTIDPIYAAKIYANDRYRIEKALLISYASKQTPTIWFNANPPKPILRNVVIAELFLPIDILRERIKQRTRKMLESDMVGEIKNLLSIAPRSAQPFKAIGVKETLDYIDGKITIEELENLINIHTAQYAKRQRTYNKGQFNDMIVKPIDELESFGADYLS